MKGYMYILQCSDGSYYTGSTTDLELRVAQHQAGEGANHTKKRLPVKLVYYEEYNRIDEAFYREKQIQGWSRKKKEALIHGKPELLPQLALAYRDIKTISGGFRNPQGGFENLSHPEVPKPEALEGEALEGEALEGEALEGEALEGEARQLNKNKPSRAEALEARDARDARKNSDNAPRGMNETHFKNYRKNENNK